MFEHASTTIDSFVEAVDTTRESFLEPLKPFTDLVYLPVREMDNALDLGESMSTLFVTF